MLAIQKQVDNFLQLPLLRFGSDDPIAQPQLIYSRHESFVFVNVLHFFFYIKYNNSKRLLVSVMMK